MTTLTLLLDVTAGPAGFNLVAACVWLSVGLAAFVAGVETMVGSN